MSDRTIALLGGLVLLVMFGETCALLGAYDPWLPFVLVGM